MRVVAITKGELSALTRQSVRDACGTKVKVVPLPAGRHSARVLAKWLRQYTTEPALVLQAGMIVQRDPWAEVPKDVHLADFARVVCSKLMYVAPGCHHPGYDTLGIDYLSNDNDRMMFVSPVPGKTRTMRMPSRMCYGPDPIVKHINEAFRQTEFHQDALKACVLDFGDQAMDWAMTTDECFAYPFDVYAKAAAKAILPAHIIATIKANAARGAVSYGLGPDLIRA